MTDRELLEMAAKAAGIEIRDSTRWANTLVRKTTMDDGTPNWVRWNPLIDDGDALRLAVKLNLQVNPTIQTYHGPASTAYDGGVGISTIQHGGDASSATREAIVRAAAEIGEAMK